MGSCATYVLNTKFEKSHRKIISVPDTKERTSSVQ